MIAEQVADADAVLSIAAELDKVTGRVAHTYASGGPLGLSSAWTTACTEFVLPRMEELAEWMVDAVAIASDLDPDTVDADDIADMVDRHLVFLAAYGDLVESAGTGATVAEGADPKLAVAGLLGPDRMATLDDRTVRHLRNQAIQLVLATAAPGTIVAVASEAAERTKKWVTMDDDRVRLAHEELHDVTIGVNEQFDCAGVLCDGPGDPVLPPESLLNCRCICCPGDTESTEDWLGVIFEIERKLAAGEIPPRARGTRPQGGTVRQVVDAIRPPEPIPVVPVAEPVIAPYPTAPPTATKPRRVWPWLLPLLLAGEDEDETTAEGDFAMRPTIDRPAVARMSTRGELAPTWDHGPGIMVAVRPTPDEAAALAIEGGEEVDQLHVTLGYLGTVDDWDEDMHAAVLLALDAIECGPMAAKVAAVGVFAENPDRPLVAFIDCDGLNELRAAVVAALDAVSPDLVRRDHGFLPHCTLAYECTDEQEAEGAARVALPLTFGNLELCWGDDSTEYPFAEEMTAVTDNVTSGNLTTFSTDSSTLHGGVRVAVDGTELVGEVELVVIDGRMEGVDGDMEATVDDPVYVVRVWVRDDEGEWGPTEERVAAHAAGLTPVAEFDDEVDDPNPTEPEDEGGDIPTDEIEMTVGIGESASLSVAVCPPRPSGAFRPAEFAMSAYRAELDARAAAGDWDWEAVMCVEGVPSGDYRQIAPGSLTWRSYPSFQPGAPEVSPPRLPRPLSLMLMVQNPETGGHALAYIAGSIWEIERDGANIVGRGFYSRLAWGEMARLLVDEGSITSTSVDLQPDFTYEIVVGADGEEQMVVTQAQVMGFTIANFGAIGEAEIWNLGGEDVVAVDDDEAEMLVASGFAVWTLDDGCYAQAEALQLAVTASADLPLAPREHEWDGDGAAQRVAEFCRNEAGDLDGACYGRAFFWRDTDAPAENVGSYRLGFADVIDGRLHAIPRGIFAVAGVLQGAMGGVDLPEADQDAIRTAVNGWYERMADEFDDDSIVPPWAAEMSPDDEGEGIDDTADPEVPEAEMAGVR